MDKLSIYSYNVRGLGDTTKRNCIFNYLKQNHNGVFFLQETHSKPDCENKWKKEWKGQSYFAHGSSSSKGVAILFSKKLKPVIKETVKDPNGRYIILDVILNEQNFVLFNNYVPTKDKPADQLKHLENIQTLMSQYENKNVILGGDLNTCLNPDIDKSGGKQEKISEFAYKLTDYMHDIDYIDIWRIRNPDSLRFTRRQKTKSGLVHSRLDMFIIPENLEYQITETDIKPSIYSDHSIISITIRKEESTSRGKGFWKFNTSLLTDSMYTDRVKRSIKDTLDNNMALKDKTLLWDLIKCKIRGLSISYSSFKAKERNKLEKELKENLETLESKLHTDDTLITEYESIKREYEQIQKYKTQGLMVRSRANYIEHGEKNSKYFFNLEKHHQDVKNIKCLVTDNNTILTKPEDILNEEVHFYKKLYTEPNNNNDSGTENVFFLNDETLPKISAHDQLFCEADITIEECAKALQQMSNSKSPGSDGFPTEFYKFFWPDIKHILMESYNYSSQTGKLSIDQRRGILSIIPKKDKDLRLLKNWRPLSLLNTDYKILTKTLASRLQIVLDTIISHDQSGYIKGRFIGENIRTMADIIENRSTTKDAGLIALLDFEKAFDTINWTFLQKTLTAFNFGTNFKNWINIFYNDISSCCLNNGNATPFFKISRGVRQGCPISALLFVLVVEVLANKIRSDPDLTGLKINDREIKISQLADDTTLFLHSFKDLEHVFSILDKFHTCSGLKLNKTKTTLFNLGNTNHRPSQQDRNFVTEFKALGIYFMKNTEEMSAFNLKERFRKFQNILNMWRQRDLSLNGKLKGKLLY